MKIYEIEIQEDGSVKVESELSPDEMKVLLHLGINAGLREGVVVASLAHYFTPPEGSESEVSAVEEEIYSTTSIDDLLTGDKKND